MHTSEFIRLFRIHDSCVSLSTVPKQVHMAIISDTRLSSVDLLAVRAGGRPILIAGTLNNPFSDFSCLTLQQNLEKPTSMI